MHSSSSKKCHPAASGAPLPPEHRSRARGGASLTRASAVSCIPELCSAPLAKVLACVWQRMIQKACCQQLSGTTFQAIRTYSFSFKGREKDMELKSDHDQTLWVQAASFLLPSLKHSVEDLHMSVYMQTVELLGRQCIYLSGQCRTGTERKHFSLPVSMHHGLSCLFKFCFLIFKKPSTIWMWSVSLRAKKQNGASVPHAEWAMRLELGSHPEPYESCPHGMRELCFQRIQ